MVERDETEGAEAGEEGNASRGVAPEAEGDEAEGPVAREADDTDADASETAKAADEPSAERAARGLEPRTPAAGPSDTMIA